MLRILKAFLLCVCLGISAQANAQELQTLTADVSVKAETPAEATKLAIAKASAENARAQVIQIVGEKRYQKNKAAYESKIIREAAKFIPFVNPGEPVQEGENFKVPVEVRISIESLRQMLAASNLLNEAEGPANLLPLIAFHDRATSTSYRWWMNENSENSKVLSQLSRQVNEWLYEEFSKQGFYVVRPQLAATSTLLPAHYRSGNPAEEDFAAIAEFFKTPLVIRGDVRFRESKNITGGVNASIKLDVFHPANARQLAEVVRTIETDAGGFETVVRQKLAAEVPGLAKDLASQVKEAWEKGTLNTSLLRLTVRANLNPKQIQAFKDGLTKAVREMKGLKERRLGGGETTFEVDYSGSSEQFAEKLKSASLQGFQLKVASVQPNGLVIDLKAAP